MNMRGCSYESIASMYTPAPILPGCLSNVLKRCSALRKSPVSGYVKCMAMHGEALYSVPSSMSSADKPFRWRHARHVEGPQRQTPLGGTKTPVHDRVCRVPSYQCTKSKSDGQRTALSAHQDAAHQVSKLEISLATLSEHGTQSIDFLRLRGLPACKSP